MRRSHRNKDQQDNSNYEYGEPGNRRRWENKEEREEWLEQKRAEREARREEKRAEREERRAEREAEREERKAEKEAERAEKRAEREAEREERRAEREERREEKRKEKEEEEKEENQPENPDETDTSGGGTDTGEDDSGDTDTSGGGTDTGGDDSGDTDTSGGGTDTGGDDSGGTDTSGGGTDTGEDDSGGTDTSGGGTNTGGDDSGGTDTSDNGGGSDETPPPPPEPEEPVLLTEYTSSAEGSEFNIHVEFVGEWTIDLQEAFIFASDYLSSVIVGDITDVYYNGEYIDDLSITADLTEIDGAGGILGQAGPTAIRTADYLPATGMMQFDVADAETFDSYGYWEQIVLHEMVHTLGFGSMWGYMGLVDGMGTDNPTFTGENATAVYESMFGLTDTNGVPIENDGGAGTAEAHWEESLFGTDLMSGYLSSGTTPELSTLSIASLEDLGYDTIFDYDTFLAG